MREFTVMEFMGIYVAVSLLHFVAWLTFQKKIRALMGDLRFQDMFGSRIL